MAGGLNAPKEIWSPAGGFYPDPRHWRRNTAFAVLFLGAMSGFVFLKTKGMERHYGTPKINVPSKRWTRPDQWTSP